MLLNMLIAQMNSTYESVLDKARVSVTQNRAEIIRRMWKSPWMKVFVSVIRTTFKINFFFFPTGMVH